MGARDPWLDVLAELRKTNTLLERIDTALRTDIHAELDRAVKMMKKQARAQGWRAATEDDDGLA